MTTILSLQLGTTDETITVDLDSIRVSLGADCDNIHCWTCASPEAMNTGAWIIGRPLDDGRLGWGADGERFLAVQPDERRRTLVCLSCATIHDPDHAQQRLTTTQLRARRAYAAGVN